MGAQSSTAPLAAASLAASSPIAIGYGESAAGSAMNSNASSSESRRAGFKRISTTIPYQANGSIDVEICLNCHDGSPAYDVETDIKKLSHHPVEYSQQVGLGGAKIELIFKDHEGNPTLGADLAKKLILDDKVHGLMGAYHSSVTKAVSAVAEQYGIPLINDSSTSPELTRLGYKWFWRTTPHDDYFTKDLFEFLKGLTEGKVKGVEDFETAQWNVVKGVAKGAIAGVHAAAVIKAHAPDIMAVEEIESLEALRAINTRRFFGDATFAHAMSIDGNDPRGIDVGTKAAVHALMSKLGAQSRTEAVVRATRQGLILL